MIGKLILSDGTVFLGQNFGANLTASGEVVFNTGMVGYPESLTDPSYFGQILVLTYPLAGNYGIPKKEFWESKKIQVTALIVQNYIEHPSHFESENTLTEWLKEQGIPALHGIDTRALTTKLRQHGVMLGKIECKVPARGEARQRRQSATLPAGRQECKVNKTYDPNKENILPLVSTNKVEIYGSGRKNIILIDCGTKENIVKSLVKRGVKVTRVPWNFDPLAQGLDFDAVLVSNGPGDPKQAKETIQTVKQIFTKNIPTFGICLGCQIMALAAGGNTFKLKFGHRGQNQPVMNIDTGKALITSQNHGFAVDTKSLGAEWQEWFFNLNDKTNEGIKHKTKPFMAVQFHPEASPGPVDAGYLFDEFIKLLK
ncbi:carbamoyl phosphate synthase small subunit [Candidatus Daviesbacteria bacterium RIFCSPHIGHO2_02_FULL_39_12]|uniref:Carbamoyl phosphate synthase small chain n=2 Tax=Candidatus Daviesiibacteriota TaxID=1752718 RepID=A0A1F5JBU6_9BACT|nr:MAG: carbamoyl phosphate synthase small subunit [Candidatus Daviesbacteria bacterium RIFCSPHIGHO2_02_FULL_39_12]OGE71371.1 MAG: carbamoyl phosphate synthase small subunit [Candidatus Daviesbacteria bacterium RIFCSPLOWO2_02_FULL_38_15]